MKQNFLVETIPSLLFSISILFLSPSSSMAQLKISVLAGVNNSKISIGNYNTEYLTAHLISRISDSSQMKSGYSFFVGLKVEKELTNSLSISSGLLLDNVEYIQNIEQTRLYFTLPSDILYSTTAKNITKLLYITVPLHLVFYAPLEKTRVYVGVGGYISYGLSGTYEFKPLSTDDPGMVDSVGAITFSSSDKIKYATYHANRIDYGLSIVAGIELRNNLFFELGFTDGLRTVFTDRYVVSNYATAEFSFQNTLRQILFGIGYRIN